MLYFTENTLTQESPTGSKTWPLPELLETHDRLRDLDRLDSLVS